MEGNVLSEAYRENTETWWKADEGDSLAINEVDGV